jgi:hypothetical protein
LSRGDGGIPRQERKRKTKSKSTGKSQSDGSAGLAAVFREAAREVLRRARALRVVNHVREFLFSVFNFD